MANEVPVAQRRHHGRGALASRSGCHCSDCGSAVRLCSCSTSFTIQVHSHHSSRESIVLVFIWLSQGLQHYIITTEGEAVPLCGSYILNSSMMCSKETKTNMTSEVKLHALVQGYLRIPYVVRGWKDYNQMVRDISPWHSIVSPLPLSLIGLLLPLSCLLVRLAWPSFRPRNSSPEILNWHIVRFEHQAEVRWDRNPGCSSSACDPMSRTRHDFCRSAVTVGNLGFLEAGVGNWHQSRSFLSTKLVPCSACATSSRQVPPSAISMSFRSFSSLIALKFWCSTSLNDSSTIPPSESRFSFDLCFVHGGEA